MEQSQYDVLYDYKVSKELPEHLSKNEKDSLRRKAKNFVITDGLLYNRDTRKNLDLQVNYASLY